MIAVAMVRDLEATVLHRRQGVLVVAELPDGVDGDALHEHRDGDRDVQQVHIEVPDHLRRLRRRNLGRCRLDGEREKCSRERVRSPTRFPFMRIRGFGSRE